ncbi:MAG: hypothetical protein ACXW11_06090 [Methylotenera sp.]
MKFHFKSTPVALAVAALFLSPLAFADVTISKNISANQSITTLGVLGVAGLVNIDSSTLAVVNDSQTSTLNAVTNNETINTSTVNGNALEGASGNIGVNVTSGDNNQQANAAAITAADASFVFGSADAEIFAHQTAGGNVTTNLGSTNSATLGGSALANASGNIGVNISAGNSNQQKNDLAISVGTARIGTATASVDQVNGNNSTNNQTVANNVVVLAPVDLTVTSTGTYSGSGSGTVGPLPLIGSVPQAFGEAGTIALAGTVTGSVPVVVAVNLATVNSSSLGDNALQAASGNIGVNIASGTNNQQHNGLAITAIK